MLLRPAFSVGLWNTVVFALMGCGGPAFSSDGYTTDAGGTSNSPDPNQTLTDAGQGTTPDAKKCPVARANGEQKTAEVCILGSQFVLGSSAANLGNSFADHSPAHNVQVSTYMIDAYEVTVGRYRQCVAAGVCSSPAGTAAHCTYTPSAGAYDDYPVICVDYSQAVAFCNWDGGRRLPTEAEWERAARGIAGNNFPWGNDPFECPRAVAAATSCLQYHTDKPSPVGSAPTGQSPDGVFDMVGNASEWVADWSASYSQTATTDPTGPATGTQRVVRGGDWLTLQTLLAAYLRKSALPASGNAIGFRCARTVK